MIAVTNTIAFKLLLKDACIELFNSSIQQLTNAMAMAQESANSQEKSSVGDKHETSRAIGQADRNMYAKQLKQAQDDLNFLRSIDVEQTFTNINIGALFEINNQTFFVALGIGKMRISDKDVVVISYRSPLFESLKMRQQGQKVLYQNKETIIDFVS
jgi:hypothetical protein